MILIRRRIEIQEIAAIREKVFTMDSNPQGSKDSLKFRFNTLIKLSFYIFEYFLILPPSVQVVISRIFLKTVNVQVRR